jgi:hypothetical protein
MNFDTLNIVLGMVGGSVMTTIVAMQFVKNFVTKNEIADLIASIKELTVAQRDIAGILIRLNIHDDDFKKIDAKLDFLQANGCHAHFKKVAT